jgi:hypothetical protein
MPYALFDCHIQVGEALPTASEVWKQVLEAGLISDIPLVDEESQEALPVGYQIREVVDKG